MAENEIKQRMTVDADQLLAVLDRVLQLEKRLVDQNQDLAKATEQASQKERTREEQLRDMRQELTELTREQLKHEAAMKDSSRLTEADARATAERERRVEAITRELKEEAEVQRRVNQLTRDGVRDADGMAGGLERIRSTAAGLVAGLVGVGGLSAALAKIRQDMDELAAKAEEVATANLNLQFLSQTFNEQEREFVNQAAAFAGRGVSDTARAYADLKSRFPQKSDQELQSLFLQVAESSRTTDAPLQAITEAFATISQFEKDPQKAQNILRESIIQAGVSDPAKLSPLFAKSLGVLTQVGGLDVGTAAGTTAAATGLGLNAEEATTGLRNVVLAITGQGTPEGRQIFDRIGLRDRSDLFGSLRQLSNAVASGDVAKSELELIAGKENIGFLSLLTDQQRLEEFIGKAQAVGAAQRSPVDLTEQAVRQQLQNDPRLSLVMNIAQQRALLEAAKAEGPEALAALEAQLGSVVFERAAREAGHGVISRFPAEFMMNRAQEIGFAPESAAVIGEFGQSGITDEVARVVGRARAGDMGVGSVTIIEQQNNISQNYEGIKPPSEQRSFRDEGGTP